MAQWRSTFPAYMGPWLGSPALPQTKPNTQKMERRTLSTSQERQRVGVSQAATPCVPESSLLLPGQAGGHTVKPAVLLSGSPELYLLHAHLVDTSKALSSPLRQESGSILSHVALLSERPAGSK